MSKPVVVAVDGSESALRATRWAAEEARRRGRALRIVHTYQWPPVAGPTLVSFESGFEAVRATAEAVVRDALAAVADDRLRCETEVVLGGTVPTLRSESERAALMVFGSRGRGGFT